MPLHDIKDGVWLIPVAARSEAWVCGCSRAGIVGVEARRWHGQMSVSCEYCVLSGRGLCAGIIIRPQESNGIRCV